MRFVFMCMRRMLFLNSEGVESCCLAGNPCLPVTAASCKRGFLMRDCFDALV